MSNSTISPEQARKRVSLAVRGLSIAGTLVLAWIEIQRRFLPNFLPLPGWHPATSLDKWLGIGIDALDFVVVFFAICLAPVYAYISIRGSRHQAGSSQWGIDLAFVVIFYVFLVASLSAGAPSH
jgi:hypothetical protein